MSFQLVPTTLFPISDKGIDIEWASKTYQFRCVFFPSERHVIPTTEDLVAWMNEAKNLCTKLRDYGTAKAEDHIVNLCNSVYNEKLEERKFKNIYDVVDMMSNRRFFQQNYDFYLDLIHMFQYGIFRCARNAWALDAAGDWMENYNIQYLNVKKDAFRNENCVKRKGKGFVYKILVSRASNTVCVRFQRLTRRIFKQYVIVRDRQVKRLSENLTIESRRFNINYDGYVIKFDNFDEIERNEHLNNVPMINDEISKALKNGHTYETILKHIKLLTTNNDEGN